mgnify:FL=1
MQETIIRVRKRDGRVEPYDSDKLCISLTAAALAVVNEEFRDDSARDGILSVLGVDGELQDVVRENYTRATIGDEMYEAIELVTELVETALEESGDIVPTSELSEIVHTALVEAGQGALLREYVLRATSRERAIESASALMRAVKELTFTNSQHSNAKRDNANVNGETAMGTMLQYGSAASKTFALNGLIPRHISDLHIAGDIHIHDLEFYVLTLTCIQLGIEDLFENGGFNTGHGHIRTPASIESYAALTCIAIQSNQNDQHGGQSIPALDHYLEKGVSKTIAAELAECVRADYEVADKGTPEDQEKLANNIKSDLFDYIHEHRFLNTDEGKQYAKSIVEKYAPDCVSTFEKIWKLIIRRTERRTRQAMESLVHNLNSMHSRAGAQIPFSSINFGTATSWEGRLIISKFLDAIDAGLGKGETPIFPISIFKLKKGVNVYPGDPNHDLFKKAIHVTSKRMYPNFSNLDAPFNLQYYQEGNVASEAAYMGCRTRVMSDINGADEVTGRGNLSFTTINLPRIALRTKSIDKFYELLDSRLELVLEQLLSRLELVSRRKVVNMPFLMQQHIWRGSDKLKPEDEIAPVLKHGTLSIGFAGLAETLVALTGKHHGEDEEVQKLGLEIIGHMRKFCDEKTKELSLNITLLATPAESACGRFLQIDRREFGVIKGVTDHEYYTNSFHVPVWYKTNARHKVEVEAPYHALTNAGHIAYVELDGAALDNEQAVEDLVMLLYNNNCGYFAISHAIDYDPVCGYTGFIGEGPCPRCGRQEFEEVPFQRLQGVPDYTASINK